jgi:glycosyltransferase involved in cell wall biosynthesis
MEEKFIWKPHLTREELMKEYIEADVVVDQFFVGGYGGIAIEAMSAGKPVMIYLNENCLNLVCPEPPPVLNCYTEDEIYKMIWKCADREFIEDIGKRAKEWVFKYYHWENCLDQFIFYYSLLTGDKKLDYGF